MAAPVRGSGIPFALLNWEWSDKVDRLIVERDKQIIDLQQRLETGAMSKARTEARTVLRAVRQ